VRIEDEVLVTDGGGVILTAAVPREAADIEAAMAGRPRGGLKSARAFPIMRARRHS